MSNYSEMTEAIRELKLYGSVSSIDDFFLKAVQMTEGSDPTAGASTELSPDARIFELITGIQDGGLFINEILAKVTEITTAAEGAGASDEESARIADTLAALKNAFYIVGAPGIEASDAGILSDITLENMLDSMLGSAAEQPTAPTKNQPSMCCIQVLPAMLNFGSRNTGSVEVFMNMIPTLEWSRALPYVDVEVITPGLNVVENSAGEKQLAGISNLRFLNGKSTITGVGDLIIGEAKSAAISAANADYDAATAAAAAATEEASVEEALPAAYSSAGMEIFTSPQTMIPVWEEYRSYDEVAALTEPGAGTTNSLGESVPWPGSPGSPRTAPIIDRMRPFMTMTNISISVKPTRGMMSHKSAEVKVILHDRSRLGEIGAFVKPASFGQTELLIEYGWSHPDSPGNNGNINNPFGKFINSLRVKEKFGVYNSKYTFTDDGQVEISLSCVTKGADSVNITDVGISPEATSKFEALEALIEAIAELRKSIVGDTPEMADVSGYSTLSNLSPTNAGDMFSGDKFAEIQEFITAMGSASGDTAALKGILEEAKETTSEIQTTIAQVISDKVVIARGTGDPYLKPRGESATDTANSKIPKHPLKPKDGSKWCSFGKLAALFIGAPLMESKRFNEVQMMFYTFNDKASFLFDQNIACFPIDLDGTTGFAGLFDEWQKEKIQISVASFMSFVNRYYLTNMACKAYGFSNLYTRDDDGKATINEDIDVSELSSKKDDVLALAYGTDTDIAFKLPRIRMIPECVPHKKPSENPDDAFGPQDTILRLHFFDDSAAKYTGLHELLASLRNSEMGAVRATTAEVSDVEGVSDAQWADIQSQFVEDMSAMSLIESVGDPPDFYRVRGGAPALKHFIKANMPSITFGSQNCSLSNLSVGSMHNSADTTIHMLRAQKAGNSDSGSPGEQDRGLPIRMMPMQASGESLGCPILNHGQQFFIDMGTGTTVDNVYAVSGLDHTIEPGNFMTKFKLIPIDAFGKYESMLNQVDKALAVIADADS